MMKRVLVSAAFLTAFATSAVAQGPMAAGYDWTGPYVGVNGGGVWENTNWNYLPLPTPTLKPEGAGGMVGGTMGLNWQFDPHWLVGLEGDMDWADVTAHTSCPNPSFSCRTSLEDFGTIRARGGYVWDRLLIFATAGGALSDVNVHTGFLPGGPVSPSGTSTNGTTKTNVGWTAGGGVEYAVWNRLSLKAEALYYDFGNLNYVVDNGLVVRTNERGLLARIGLNWNFGAPPPPPPPPMAHPMPAAAPAPPPPMARTYLVFFDFDRYNLTPDARRVIEAAAQSYKEHGSARIEVSGYTDLAGTQAYNLRLSQRRADAVASYLAKRGVPKNVMDVKWYGKEHPRVPTPDGVREPQNRRVEIVMP